MRDWLSMHSSAHLRTLDSERSKSENLRSWSVGVCALVGIYKQPLTLQLLSISLLTNFEDASSYLDWTLGVHGIYISFSHPSVLPALSSPSSSSTPSPLSSSTSLLSVRPRFSKPARNLTATYLPDVAPEQGWTKVEAVDSAIRKAGWDGRINEDIRRSVTLRRYQSRKCVVSWDEYHSWRIAQGGVV